MENYKKHLERYLDPIVNRYGKRKYLWIDEDDEVHVYLYTDGHRYSIKAKKTYLGCIASSRKMRPGEDWVRGNDLADGEFCRETWIRILEDIVAYELKSISDYITDPPPRDPVPSQWPEPEAFEEKQS